MILNKEKFVEDIFRGKCDGSYARCGAELGVSSQYIYKLVNDAGSKAGQKLLGALVAYCDKNQMNWRDYIFLPDS